MARNVGSPTGERDTLIVVESKAVTRDAYGGEVATWTTFKRAWAKRMDTFAVEGAVMGIVQAQRHMTLEIPYLDGLTTAMRVRIAASGTLLNILGILENGRVSMTLHVEESSSANP